MMTFQVKNPLNIIGAEWGYWYNTLDELGRDNSILLTYILNPD